MTTTLILDADVDALLHEAVQQQGKPLDQLINETLRDALSVAKSAEPREPYKVQPRDMGKPLIDLTHTGRVLADLETADYLEKMSRCSTSENR